MSATPSTPALPAASPLLTIDPRFAALVIPSTRLDCLHTGSRWTEAASGPAPMSV